MSSLFDGALREKYALSKIKDPLVFMKRDTRFRINRFDYHSFNGKER
jgi:hypothetical protein